MARESGGRAAAGGGRATGSLVAVAVDTRERYEPMRARAQRAEAMGRPSSASAGG